MTTVTKENLLELVKKMTTDSIVEKINHGDACRLYSNSLKKGINIYSKEIYKNRIKYFYKGEVVSQDFGDLWFEKIKTDWSSVVNFKHIEVIFDREPPIIIRPKEELKETKTTIIKGRKFFIIPETIKAVEYENKPIYTLTCGRHKFDLEEQEVEELYQFIIDETTRRKKEIEDEEITLRFKTYNIK